MLVSCERSRVDLSIVISLQINYNALLSLLTSRGSSKFLLLFPKIRAPPTKAVHLKLRTFYYGIVKSKLNVCHPFRNLLLLSSEEGPNHFFSPFQTPVTLQTFILFPTWHRLGILKRGQLQAFGGKCSLLLTLGTFRVAGQ